MSVKGVQPPSWLPSQLFCVLAGCHWARSFPLWAAASLSIKNQGSVELFLGLFQIQSSLSPIWPTSWAIIYFRCFSFLFCKVGAVALTPRDHGRC